MSQLCICVMYLSTHLAFYDAFILQLHQQLLCNAAEPSTEHFVISVECTCAFKDLLLKDAQF